MTSTTAPLVPLAVMAFLFGLLLVIGYIMPRLTRPDIYFAVTVPPGFRDSAGGPSFAVTGSS